MFHRSNNDIYYNVETLAFQDFEYFLIMSSSKSFPAIWSLRILNQCRQQCMDSMSHLILTSFNKREPTYSTQLPQLFKTFPNENKIANIWKTIIQQRLPINVSSKLIYLPTALLLGKKKYADIEQKLNLIKLHGIKSQKVLTCQNFLLSGRNISEYTASIESTRAIFII